MKRKIFACLFLSVVLFRCAAPPDPPMRIGTDSWPGSAPLHLAQRSGLLDDRFRLVDSSTTSESVRSFRNGALDAACLTMDEALRMVRDGLDLVIVFVLDESRGGDALLARPGIKDIRELKGKRVGVELGAGGSFMLTRGLRTAGMTAGDVRPIYLASDKHLEWFMAGDVDAVVTYEPARTRIMDAGAIELFSSAMIPGELVDLVVAHGDYVRRHPEHVRALRKAWFAALDRIHERPTESVYLMARRLQVSPEQLTSMLTRIHMPDSAESKVLIGGAHPTLKDSANRLVAVMKENDLLSANIDVSSLFSAPID